MSDSCTISVVVPAYNVEAFIVDALDSLLRQRVPFHEIIVVNDGSTDGTNAILADMSRIGVIRIIDVENGGQGRARNIGAGHATGEFVYFFDADDLLKVDFVEAMQALVKGDPALDIIYFSGESFVDGGFSSDFVPDYQRKLNAVFDDGVSATGAMLTHDVYFAQPCLYLSRRALWRKHGLAFAHIIHEDEEIMSSLSCAAGRSLCQDRVFFQRRIRANSTMTVAKCARNTEGFLRTLDAIALQCRRDRTRLAPIRPLMVRRFYALAHAYLTMCKKIGQRPAYGQLLHDIRTLGSLPGLDQLIGMTVLPRALGRLARIGRRFRRAG